MIFKPGDSRHTARMTSPYDQRRRPYSLVHRERQRKRRGSFVAGHRLAPNMQGVVNFGALYSGTPIR